MALKLSNNADGLLALAISDSDTSLTLEAGHGSRFPALGSGDWFPITVVRASDPSQFEIMRCTGRGGDTLTVERAQEGTAAITFSAGDVVELRLTSGTLEENFPQVEGRNAKNLRFSVKPIADPAAPITGSLLSGAMLAAGAIVEMGVNANGNYVRWESGLQACWNYNFIIHPGTPPREPGVYSATWTFPASFISTSFYVGQTPTTTRPDLRGTISVGERSASSATIYRYDDSYADVNLNSTLVAIGMWK